MCWYQEFIFKSIFMKHEGHTTNFKIVPLMLSYMNPLVMFD